VRSRRDALDVGGLRQPGARVGDAPTPLAVHPYPVLEEIRSYGFQFFDIGDVTSIGEFLMHPDNGRLETNLAIARTHFNVTHLPEKLATVLNLDESDVRESNESEREAQ
jgi:hypothetical protein